MHGPKPAGFWTSHSTQFASDFQFLKPGRRYKVIMSFRDYDMVTHLSGEEWRYLGHSFSPHEDGLSLFVSLDEIQEWMIRLQWREEEQGRMLGALHHYLSEV